MEDLIKPINEKIKKQNQYKVTELAETRKNNF